jgi:hypothetical protein
MGDEWKADTQGTGGHGTMVMDPEEGQTPEGTIVITSKDHRLKQLSPSKPKKESLLPIP